MGIINVWFTALRLYSKLVLNCFEVGNYKTFHVAFANVKTVIFFN
jgi:hypothetical protein